MMKKSAQVIVLMVFCLANVGLNAQEQLQHPTRLYKGEDGKLYVNRNQPMYLFIGSSPDVNAPMQKIESQTTPKYVNPFYFDAEGHNTIRTPSQVDTITKQIVYPLADIIFDVYADGIAPVTKATFNNAASYTKEGKTYYGKGLSVILSARDQMSGVDQTYFSLDGSPFKVINETLTFDQEKEYSLSFYSVDNVGNVEATNKNEFTVDTTPPVANWSLEGTVHGNAASGSSKIVIMAQDVLSGIKHIKYQIDEQPVRNYTNGISLNTLPSGAYQLRYWAEDNVGNIFEGSDGGTNVYAFVVDRTPPSTFANVVGDHFKDNKFTYVSNRSKCQLAAEDTISGIQNIIYGFEQRIMDEIYEQPFVFEDKTGLQTVYFQALDMVSNRSTIEKLSVFMDNLEPVSRIEYTGPQFFTRDTLFISNETSVRIVSEDKESGVAKVEYRINNGNFVGADQFKIAESGFNTVGFRATDNVGNIEQEKQSEFVVDNVPPEIFVNFSIKAIREETIEGETISVFPPYVKIYIGATDKYCGTKDIFYSIDGGAKRKYAGVNSPADSELFKDEKLYEVMVEATDMLGNISTKPVKFRVARR